MAQEFHWNTKDGIKIYAVNWQVEKPKALVCLVHGLGEHSHRYDHLAEYYNKNGFAVVAYDRRGHGRSEGKRGHTANYEAFLEEVDQLITSARGFYPNTPVFIYGHSMGGNIVLNYLLRRKPANILGTITTGAWVKLALPTPWLLVKLSKLINAVYPTMAFSNKLDGDMISSISEEARKYENDPHVHATITASTAVEMLKAAEYLENYKGTFPTPLLLMHGASDPIVDPVSSSNFAKQVTGDITHQEFKGKHEIHYEQVRQELFDTTIKWMEARI